MALLLYGAWEIHLLEAFFEGWVRLSPLRPIEDEYSDLTLLFRRSGVLHLPYYRTPLTSLFFFAAYLLTGGMHWVPFAYSVLYLAAVAFFYCGVARHQGIVFAFLAGVALIFYSPLPYIAYRFSEGLGFSLLIFAAGFFWREAMERSPAHRLGTAVSLSLLVLTRSNFMFLLWAFTTYLVYVFFVRQKQEIGRVALLGLIAILHGPLQLWQGFNWARGTSYSANNLAWTSVAALALPSFGHRAWAEKRDPDAGALNQALADLSKRYRVAGPNRICISAPHRPVCYEENHFPVYLQVATFPAFIWIAIEGAVAASVPRNLPDRYRLARIVRLREKLSRIIVLDVLRRRPLALAEAVWRNFETAAFRPYLITVGEFVPDRARLACLAGWIAALLCCGLGVMGETQGEGRLVGLAVAGAAFHLASLIVISVFGVPYERYVTMTLPFLFLGPLVLGRISWSYLKMNSRQIWPTWRSWAQGLVASPSRIST